MTQRKRWIALTGALALAAAVTASTLTAPATAAPSASAATDQRQALRQVAERDATTAGQAQPRAVGPEYFIDDPDYFFYWRQDDPAQDCFPGLNCEIEQVDMYVPKSDENALITLAYTDRTTDGSIPTSPVGLVAVYLDTNGDSTWDYATLAPNRFFAPDTYYDWYMYFWNGSTWVRMNIEATWYRGAYFWGAIMPWRLLDISAASMAMEICDTRGACDVAPGTGTPLIDVQGAVDGLLPNAPSRLTATYTVKGKKATARITWQYTGPGGPNSIINYSYRASNNNGRTWTAWRTSTSNRVTVTGLTKGRIGLFEVKAQNRLGYGPAARIRLNPR